MDWAPGGGGVEDDPVSTTPGYYLDPTDSSRERWWTGSQWTETYRPLKREEEDEQA